MKIATVLLGMLCAGCARGEVAFDGDAALSGMKCTAKGSPTENTEQLGYLDHFALEFKLKGTAGAAEKVFVSAWFGRLAENQLQAKFAQDADRGTPYEIVDSAGKSIPSPHSDNPKAIPFHLEASNKATGRADLSKGIGGTPVPLIAASAGTLRLYSSMHQRFSYSLIGLSARHFTEFGARYSGEQLEALPPGIYHLRLPFTIALFDANSVVRAVKHGQRSMKLDLCKEKRAATVESFKGSGSPLLIFESEDKK